MKFNWGHGIVLVLALAITGLLSLVYITSQQRVDMVTEDYYPKELKYEDQIRKIKNYNALEERVVVENTEVVKVTFPKEIGTYNAIKGIIHFYRPSDKNLDIEEEIVLNEDYSIEFSKAKFKEGKYQVLIEWQLAGVEYLSKQDIYID